MLQVGIHLPEYYKLPKKKTIKTTILIFAAVKTSNFTLIFQIKNCIHSSENPVKPGQLIQPTHRPGCPLTFDIATKAR